MERFYENLWDRKLTKIDAMREAQLWMLREGKNRGLDIKDQDDSDDDTDRLSPKYWAAFVLSGDWR